MQKKNHKTRMLEWIDELGLIVVQSEIKPYGPGTRRYMVGRHTEEPKHNAWQTAKWQMGVDSLEYKNGSHSEPLDGPALEKWLT